MPPWPHRQKLGTDSPNQHMFNHVLFPTDFSPYADAVFACLPELKHVGMGEVTLLGIIRPDSYSLGPAFESETLDKIQWGAEERLYMAQMALEGKGLRVHVRVEVGQPAAAISRIAGEEHVDMIAMGAQGATLAQELLLGSVAQEVLRRATVPVLIYKFYVVRELGHVECRRMCDSLFTRVLFPTDFSDFATAAFQIVKKLKMAGTEEVIVLHVQDERVMKQRQPYQLDDFDRQDAARLEELINALVLNGLPSQAVLRHGNPVKEVLAAVDAMGISLIVLGSQGRSAMQELTTGSTLERVVRLAKQPVLMIRPPTDLR